MFGRYSLRLLGWLCTISGFDLAHQLQVVHMLDNMSLMVSPSSRIVPLSLGNVWPFAWSNRYALSISHMLYRAIEPAR